MAKKQTPDNDSRTQEDVDKISQIVSDVVWIKGLAPAGNRDFVNAIFKHQDKYTPTTTAAAFWYVCDTHEHYAEELLTKDIVKKANTITRGIFAAMIERSCPEWSADEFRKLTRQFVPHFNQWETAIGVIRMHSVNNFDQLMALMPAAKSS